MGCSGERIEPWPDSSRYPEYEHELFGIYVMLYENRDFTFNDKVVRFRRYAPNYDPKSSFYHLIMESRPGSRHDNYEDNRVPEPRRCEFIRWARYLIEYCIIKCDDILVWDKKINGEDRTLLWCKAFAYLVVVAVKPEVCYIVSAYPVIEEHRMRKLQNEYDEFITDSRNRPD